MKTVTIEIPAGPFTTFGAEAVGQMVGSSTRFTDADGVEHEALIVGAEVIHEGAAISAELELPEEAKIGEHEQALEALTITVPPESLTGGRQSEPRPEFETETVLSPFGSAVKAIEASGATRKGEMPCGCYYYRFDDGQGAVVRNPGCTIDHSSFGYEVEAKP